MKESGKKYLLIAAAFCTLLLGTAALSGSQVLMLICLPFTAAGNGLRWLSLSGHAGNVAAIVVYILISMLPLLLLLRHKLQIEDLLLPLCTLAVFCTLYYMINPGFRPLALTGETGTLIYSGGVYSILLAWWIVKLVRYCDKMGASKIYRALRIFLLICGLECLWIGVSAGFFDLTTDIHSIQLENTMPNLNLLPTYFVRILTYVVWALEYGLDALVMFLGIKLLQKIEQDPYSADSCRAAEKVARWCKISMVTIILAHAGLNLMQMIMAKWLHTLAASFRLPILSMAIVFAMLALTRLLGQGRQIKEDNDLFI